MIDMAHDNEHHSVISHFITTDYFEDLTVLTFFCQNYFNNLHVVMFVL